MIDTPETTGPGEGLDLPWPPEMEAEDTAPPADDFDLARLWRRVRREQAEIARFKAYLARVTDHVQAAIARREDRIAEIKALTYSYLSYTGARKAILPDLGTVHLITRRQVQIDVAAAMAWAEQDGREFVLLEPRLDREGLKRHLLATGEVVPGTTVEEVTTVAFRPR